MLFIKNMKVFFILKLLFCATLIIFNSLLVAMLYQIEDNKCLCAKEYTENKFWGLFKKIEFLKYFSISLASLAFINIFIPLTKGISHIILIGGFISLVLLVGLVLQAYLLNDLISILTKDECNNCKFGGLFDAGKVLMTGSIISYSIVIILVLLGLMYM